MSLFRFTSPLLRRSAITTAFLLLICGDALCAAPRLEVAPVGSILDPIALSVVSDHRERVRVHVLTNVLNGKPSYSWGEYDVQIGRTELTTLPQVSGMSAISSYWKLFWFQVPLSKNPPFEFYSKYSRQLTKKKNFIFLLERGGEVIDVQDLLVDAQLSPRIRTVSTGSVRGTFYVPNGKGPFPLLMVVGGHPHKDLDQLGLAMANRGVAVFHVNYHSSVFGHSCFERVRESFFLEALEFAKRSEHIDASRVGILGISRGAEIVPYIAKKKNGIRFAAMAVFSAWPLAAGCFGSDAPWMVEGRPVSYLHAVEPARLRADGMQRVFQSERLLRHIDKNFGLPETLTPMGQVDVPTLLIGAERDRLVPSAVSIELICAKYGCDGSSVFRSFIAEKADHGVFDVPWMAYPCTGNTKPPTEPFGICEVTAAARNTAFDTFSQFVAEQTRAAAQR